jgi:hypothetical protein
MPPECVKKGVSSAKPPFYIMFILFKMRGGEDVLDSLLLAGAA